MKRLAKLPTLKDYYPNIEDYDFVDNGIQNVNVSDIIGLSDSRVDEYNDDWSPKDSRDSRWLRLYNGYQQGDNIEPIPLIETPDGKYFPDGDGNHRISVVKSLNIATAPAKVQLMVPKEKGVDQSWQEHAKDKIEKLEQMSKKYQSMWPKFYELQDKAFESGEHKEYNKFKKEMDELGNEINKLDHELMSEETEYKQNFLKGARVVTRLRKIANAYDWVQERAEHIRDNNPDMNEGMEYGIAWKQYKKKNPKWKNKKQKERLKRKKAEFLDGFTEEFTEQYMEVYKDPSFREINEVKKQDEYNSIRGVILDDGTIYCWPGSIVHTQINQYLNVPVNNVFRFAFEENWIIDLHKVFTKEQGLEMIKKYESILSKFGNIRADYFIYEPSDVSERYLDLKYDDVYKKVAKVAKIHEGFNGEKDNYLEVFINPSVDEIQNIKKSDSNNSIRGVVTHEGDIYIWSSDVMHNKVNNYITNKIDIGNIRFEYDSNDNIISIDCYDKQNWEEIVVMMKNSQNFFDTISNLSTTFSFWCDSDDSSFDMKYEEVFK